MKLTCISIWRCFLHSYKWNVVIPSPILKHSLSIWYSTSCCSVQLHRYGFSFINVLFMVYHCLTHVLYLNHVTVTSTGWARNSTTDIPRRIASAWQELRKQLQLLVQPDKHSTYMHSYRLPTSINTFCPPVGFHVLQFQTSLMYECNFCRGNCVLQRLGDVPYHENGNWKVMTCVVVMI